MRNGRENVVKKHKKKAVEKGINLRHWLQQKLRRISYQWPNRKDAIVKSRMSRGRYKCASCEGEFGRQEIQLDHIVPVIDPHVGFVDWNTYIDRLFSAVSNFQTLCKPCHNAKTFRETEVRKQVKSRQDPDDEI